MIMGLFEEIETFCKTTSMKGVPRILNSSSLSLKTLWLLAVVGFLGLSGYEAYRLIYDFASFPKVTSITEKILNLTGDTEGVDLPDIMLCNLKPFDSEKHNNSAIPSVQQYHQRVMDVTTCTNCTVNEKRTLMAVRAGLLTQVGYYQYIGDSSVSKIGHNLDNFMVSCNVIVLDGLFYSTAPCEGRVNITEYISRVYFKCFNYHLFQKEQVMGISMVVYLDTFDFELFEYFGIATDLGQRLGMQALVYEQGTAPLITKDGISLAHGTYSDVKFTIEQRVRLPEPHGTCSEQLEIENLDIFETDNEKTTMESCSSYCVEKHVAERCGCLDAMSLGILESQRPDIPYCASVTMDQKELLQKILCAKVTRNVVMPSCLQSCPLTCKELFYPIKMSQSTWPQRPLQPSFYNHYIKNHVFEWRFANVSFQKRTKEVDTFSSYSHDASIVRENFLKVTFYLGDNKYLSLEDSPKVTSSNLISQLGGSLNLWSGITMILFVEIIEFMIRVIMPRSRSMVSINTHPQADDRYNDNHRNMRRVPSVRTRERQQMENINNINGTI